jgi:hypothetical protein
MAASNTFAIKEVIDFVVERYSSSGRGSELFHVDYASNTNFNITGERLPLRGGQGNYKLLDIDHSKDCQYVASLPLIDINALAEKLGRSVSTGAKTAFKREILTADGSNQITVAGTPLSNTLIIHALDNDRDLGTEQTAGTPATTEDEYSISGLVVTLNATTAPEETKFVATYNYTSGENAQNIKITANDFPGFVTIRGRGLYDDDQLGVTVPVSFTIHKAKVLPSFELTAEEGAATVLDFTVDCYPILNSDSDREFVDMVKLNDEAV